MKEYGVYDTEIMVSFVCMSTVVQFRFNVFPMKNASLFRIFSGKTTWVQKWPIFYNDVGGTEQHVPIRPLFLYCIGSFCLRKCFGNLDAWIDSPTWKPKKCDPNTKEHLLCRNKSRYQSQIHYFSATILTWNANFDWGNKRNKRKTNELKSQEGALPCTVPLYSQ